MRARTHRGVERACTTTTRCVALMGLFIAVPVYRVAATKSPPGDHVGCRHGRRPSSPPPRQKKTAPPRPDPTPASRPSQGGQSKAHAAPPRPAPPRDATAVSAHGRPVHAHTLLNDTRPACPPLLRAHRSAPAPQRASGTWLWRAPPAAAASTVRSVPSGRSVTTPPSGVSASSRSIAHGAAARSCAAAASAARVRSALG